MSLEDIEKELYGQKNKKVREIKPQSEEKTENSSSFSQQKRPQNPWRDNDISIEEAPTQVPRVEKIGSKVFAGLIIALVVLIGFAGYYLYQYFTTRDVQFTMSAPKEVKVGEPFTMTVLFHNVSKKPLYEPLISIQLPEGAIYADAPTKRVIEEGIEDSMPGDSMKRDYKIVLLGAEYRTYQFNAEVSYRYKASSLSSKFQKASSVSTVARNPVMSVDITMPSSVVQGQDFEFMIRYKNETETTLENTFIQVQLPQGFSLSNSDPKLDKERILLNKLEPQKEGTIIISGVLSNISNNAAQFGASAVLVFDNKEYPIASKSNSISLTPSPLRVEITSNQKDATVTPGEKIDFAFKITNTASIPLPEVTAQVKFVGDLFNLSTVQGDGALQDSNRTYVWNGGNVEALRQLEPGESVTLPFSITLLSGYAPKGIPFKNNELQILASAVSPVVPPGLTAQKTIGMETYKLKIEGMLDVQSFVYYAEPNNEIKNTGPMPPKAGNETTFTIHWKLVSLGSDMEQVKVKGVLGTGMKWTGKINVLNTSQVPKFNASTGEVIWEIDKIEAKTATQAPEAIFQISFTPGSNTVGSQYIFLQNIAFSAKDMFTGKNISSAATQQLDSRDFADARALELGYDKIRP